MIELGTITNVAGTDVTLDTKITVGLAEGNFADGMEVAVLAEHEVTAGATIQVASGSGLGYFDLGAAPAEYAHENVQVVITLPDASGETTTATFSGASTATATASAGTFDAASSSISSLKDCFDSSALAALGAATVGSSGGNDVLTITPTHQTQVPEKYSVTLVDNVNGAAAGFTIATDGANTTKASSIDNSGSESVLTVVSADNLNTGEKLYKVWTGSQGTKEEFLRKHLLGYI